MPRYEHSLSADIDQLPFLYKKRQLTSSIFPWLRLIFYAQVICETRQDLGDSWQAILIPNLPLFPFPFPHSRLL